MGQQGQTKKTKQNKKQNSQHKRTKGTIWFYPNGKGLKMICLTSSGNYRKFLISGYYEQTNIE